MIAVRQSPTRSDQEAAEALQRLFREQVSEMPPLDEVASTAVSRALRIRGRRFTASSVAVSLVFVLVLTAAVTLRAWGTDSPNSPVRGLGLGGDPQVAFDLEPSEFTPVVAPVSLRADVHMGNQLWDATASTWRPLSISGADLTVVRTRIGWLTGDETGLWLLRADGMPVALLPAGERWTVNGDGTQLASVEGTTLRLARLTANGLQDVASTTVGAGDVPIGFVSTSVLLATADRGRFALWRQGSAYRTAGGFLQIFGSARPRTFGLVANGNKTCLVRTTVADGSPRPDAYAGCHELLAQGADRAVMSPDGQYLATPFSGGMWIIDLGRSVAAAQRDRTAPPVWVSTCASDATATPVWIDAETVLIAANGGFVACGVDGSQRTVQLPEGVSPRSVLVPIRR